MARNADGDTHRCRSGHRRASDAAARRTFIDGARCRRRRDRGPTRLPARGQRIETGQRLAHSPFSRRALRALSRQRRGDRPGADARRGAAHRADRPRRSRGNGALVAIEYQPRHHPALRPAGAGGDRRRARRDCATPSRPRSQRPRSPMPAPSTPRSDWLAPAAWGARRHRMWTKSPQPRCAR